MDIENHTTKDVCHLKYDAYNYFGRDTPRKVLAVYFFSQLFAWPSWLLWEEGEEMGGNFVISVIMLQVSVCQSTYCCGTENFTIIS